MYTEFKKIYSSVGETLSHVIFNYEVMNVSMRSQLISHSTLERSRIASSSLGVMGKKKSAMPMSSLRSDIVFEKPIMESKASDDFVSKTVSNARVQQMANIQRKMKS